MFYEEQLIPIPDLQDPAIRNQEISSGSMAVSGLRVFLGIETSVRQRAVL